jgi:TPR repeat protein
MKLALHALAAIILVLSLSAPVAAGPLDDGGAAYNRGDYATALRLLRPLANQGDAGAQIKLGLMYFWGRGVPQNDAEALKWYRLAADQGNASGQYFLGRLYADGEGVPQNYAEALKWFRLAADQGDASTQYFLGLMYANGEGVPQDYVRAHMWFNLSAAKGDQVAARNRDNISKLMTPAQIAEAQKLAREWRPAP